MRNGDRIHAIRVVKQLGTPGKTVFTLSLGVWVLSIQIGAGNERAQRSNFERYPVNYLPGIGGRCRT
jgi:hypothetical protein